MDDIPSISRILGAVVFYCYLIWTGYRARRPHWTRKSWRRFGLITVVLFSLQFIGFAMAVGVDNGVYNYVRDFGATLYLYTMLALTLLGTLALASLVIWFAWGDPKRDLALRKTAEIESE